MSRRKISDQQARADRSIAESPYPLMAVRPRGVLLKSERRIVVDEHFMNPTPPATPEKRRAQDPLSSPSPSKRKKDPYACLFIQRPPSGSPSSSNSTDHRHVSSPFPSSSSPSRRRIGNRCISGPSPGIFYAIVPQAFLGLAGQLPVIPIPDEDCVFFSNFPEIGCNMFTPDCVSTKAFTVTSQNITIGFKWTGYEVLGEYETRFHISKTSSPFNTRREILGKIKDMFVKFRRDVQADRVLRMGNRNYSEMDVLKYGDSDFRVSKLERRHSSYYQVIFKVPAVRG